MVAIDTSVLIAAAVSVEAFHTECRALVASGGCYLYSHGIVEAFSTLTGGRKNFRLSSKIAAEILDRFVTKAIQLAALPPTETLKAMQDAESRGVRGGAIFDYLHLVAARKAKAAKFYTLNYSNFKAFHRAGDPEIVHP